MAHTKERLWRTLVRFEERKYGSSDYVPVVIPAWNPNEIIDLKKSKIPENVLNSIDFDSGNIRFYVHVNIGAENKDELIFENWEK